MRRAIRSSARSSRRWSRAERRGSSREIREATGPKGGAPSGGRGSAAQWRPTRGARRHGPIEVRSALALEAQFVGGRSDLRLSSRSTDSASLAGPEPHFRRHVPPRIGGRFHASGKGVSRMRHGVTKLRGPPSETASARGSPLESSLLSVVEGDDSCSLFLWPMRRPRERTQDETRRLCLGNKLGARRPGGPHRRVRRRRAALSSGDCPGSHRDPDRGERRNRNAWKSRNDK